jgi:hypothetical protein
VATLAPRVRSCLFVFLFLSFLKSCLIASCLILDINFYNIYLIFLYIKNLKSNFK